MSQLGAGAALAIRSAALRANDQLSIQMMDGTTVGARIADLSSDSARIEVGDQSLTFRPWRYGDRTIGRFPGDNSTWTALDHAPALQAAK
jgi:hypothetical protein